MALRSALELVKTPSVDFIFGGERLTSDRKEIAWTKKNFHKGCLEMPANAAETLPVLLVGGNNFSKLMAKTGLIPFLITFLMAFAYPQPGASDPFGLTPADIESTNDPVYIILVAATMADDQRYVQLGRKYFSALGLGYSSGTVTFQPPSITYGLGFDDNFNMGFPKKKFYQDGLLFEIDADQVGKSSYFMNFQGNLKGILALDELSTLGLNLAGAIQYSPSLQFTKVDAQFSICSRSILWVGSLFSACFSSSKTLHNGKIESANYIETESHSLVRFGNRIAKIALLASLYGSEISLSEPELLNFSLGLSGVVPLGRERSIGIAFNLGFPAEGTHGTKHAFSVPIQVAALGGEFQIEPSLAHATGGYFAGDPLEDWTASLKITSRSLGKVGIYVELGLTRSSADIYSDEFIEIGMSIKM